MANTKKKKVIHIAKNRMVSRNFVVGKFWEHCVKYVRILVFTDMYIAV